MCECCLVEHCVISWSSYGLKQVIPWHFFCFSSFILILCLPVHEKHKHSIFWDRFVSAYGAATALNKEYLGIFFCFSLSILFLCLPVHKKYKIFLFRGALCQNMDQLRP